MKRVILSATVMLACIAATAKDIKTMVVTPSPKMVCENCENKIKGNLRFEKGVKNIETDLTAQTITITYDGDKTSEEKLSKALNKIGYTAADGCCKGEAKQGCCKGEAGQGCCKKEAAQGCCKKETAQGCCKKESAQGCCKQEKK